MGRVSLQSERLRPLLTPRALTLSVCSAKALDRQSAKRDGGSAERQAEVIAWDRAGRLYSVWRDGRTARRGLSGRVLEKWHDGGEARRAWLDPMAIDALVDHAASRALAALTALPSSESTPVLKRAAAFDAAAARADAARCAKIYSDIGILPPDQYLAVVVQATEGCSFRTCDFCDLFGRPYRVKSLDEFRQHVADVCEYMGDSLMLRGRSAFLGAANALALPAGRLAARLEIVRGAFGVPITGFVDGHTGAVKSAADYRDLARAGLRRVYVGLESGHDPLLALVHKPSRAAEAIETIRALKAGGIAVGVIVMIGLGGQPFDDAHAADTIDVLNRMPLGAGDLIYFSELVAPPRGRYAALAQAEGIAPLDGDARRAQARKIRAGLVFRDERAQIATYDIREFVY